MKLTAISIAGISLLVTAGTLAQPLNNDKQAHEALAGNAGHLMGPPEFQALPSKPPDHRISYGKDPNQFGELRVPPGAGPHPVAILIHGGCWKADFSNLKELGPIGDSLKAKGVATWNIEYRRLSEDGSGWPGTYIDVGTGVDHMRSIAERYRLDLARVIVVGHSAGGNLALWVASRFRLPKSSALFANNPLPICGVISLAGTGDMEANIQIEKHGCGDTVVEKMLGGTPADVPERYAQVSAIKMPAVQGEILSLLGNGL
jgi:pimeloyl-ACP methyl ester carboxylesterase